MKSRGLGDDIEKLMKASGVKIAFNSISKFANAECGCKKRRDKLNKIFPYKQNKIVSKPKKKFKDTKVGGFLTKNGSYIARAIGDSMPDKGLLGLAKNLITDDKDMSEGEKATALGLLELDVKEMDDVTERWEADASSDNKLAKIARPVIVLYLTLVVSVYIILDSFGIFTMRDSWVNLMETLLVTVYIAYFGSRGVEKYSAIKSRQNK